MTIILAGDIGATKTDLALFSTEAGPRAPLAQRKYPSQDYPSLAAIVGEFLSQTEFIVERACFGVAGPVVEGVAKTTNLPWLIQQSNLRKQFGLATVLLLNDLEATASAVPCLTPGDLRALNTGQAQEHGAVAVIAPGTGLGEAFPVWDGSRYRAYSSEGGHAGFAPADAAQVELLEFVRGQFDHVSFERVCSGKGMPSIYQFLRGKDAAPELAEVAEAIARTTDKARVIIDSALDAKRPSPLCAATLEMFVSILAAEAGNLALKVLATGGVYLGGGIPINILPALEERFVEAFRRKGRFSELLADIPIHVMHSDAGLIGAGGPQPGAGAAGASVMKGEADIVFLVDAYNTLLDNDEIEGDLKDYLERTFGPECQFRYWEIFEELRAELGYADYVGALQRYRVEHLLDPHLLEASLFLIDYPFADRLYPDSLDVIKRLKTWGPTVILSDGDVVFQPRKVQRSSLRDAVQGHTLIYIHKEQMLAGVELRYPSRHYVMIDDKLRIFAAMKEVWRDRLTTVFVRQGHYAHDPENLASFPPADLAIENIGEILGYEIEGLVSAGSRSQAYRTPASREQTSS